MAYSLGLTLYHLAARREASPSGPRPARPAGRLLWLHAPGVDAARPLAELGARLAAEEGHPVLVTCPEPCPPLPGLIWQPPPPETQAEVRAFLDHWHPEIGVFAEGELRPALLHEAHERGVDLMLVDGRAPHFLRGRDGWWPGLMRGLLGQFSHILTLDEPAARAFRRAGGLLSAVKVAGRMEERSAALPCTEAERAALARLLATRPVWLAACLPEAEEDAVIAAHRAALRLAHRLLLIVVPHDPARTRPLAERMQAEQGWTVACRASDEEPDPETEVYIVENAAELGLWYRLAPVTYLGGSLSASGCQRDPMEGAALGSALIHGPKSGAHGAGLARLHGARAAVAVASGAELAEALSDLLAPDRAARLAQQAWVVASDGAEVTDRVIALICRLLDERR
ncbi:3-deoxy-D-manno-octulosonic acid transferase [Fertoebacter nigrum]|uniref:3-deoxy-D-manno-octulosonic acid transferase n=1 Tax=Fertoeibacter niger TaxID=2656921 RepID=A0A8X8GXW6_9RHOB|nr:glycosyltransferase N-terminal domain-containing protein [Fertoeibacter niger]NUB46338.1 3-deoxy-D-manno-octulosonic acid transferase [Fertoeibacter niger]